MYIYKSVYNFERRSQLYLECSLWVLKVYTEITEVLNFFRGSATANENLIIVSEIFFFHRIKLSKVLNGCLEIRSLKSYDRIIQFNLSYHIYRARIHEGIPNSLRWEAVLQTEIIMYFHANQKYNFLFENFNFILSFEEKNRMLCKVLLKFVNCLMFHRFLNNSLIASDEAQRNAKRSKLEVESFLP